MAEEEAATGVARRRRDRVTTSTRGAEVEVAARDVVARDVVQDAVRLRVAAAVAVVVGVVAARRRRPKADTTGSDLDRRDPDRALPAAALLRRRRDESVR